MQLLRTLSFSPRHEAQWFLAAHEQPLSGVQFNQLAARESENRSEAKRFALAAAASLSVFVAAAIHTNKPVIGGASASLISGLLFTARRERKRQLFWTYVSDVERTHGLGTAYRFLQSAPTSIPEVV